MQAYSEKREISSAPNRSRTYDLPITYFGYYEDNYEDIHRILNIGMASIEDIKFHLALTINRRADRYWELSTACCFDVL